MSTEQQSTLPKLDTKKLTPINREAQWDEEKKIALKQAFEEYPHIPQIAIEACYDFAKKYENDITIEKYIKGEYLTEKQIKKVRNILHPNGYKIERNTYKDGEELNQVNIIKSNLCNWDFTSSHPNEPFVDKLLNFNGSIINKPDKIVNSNEIVNENQGCKII